MDLNAVLLNYGSVLEAGQSEFVWNDDGTLGQKNLYADPAMIEPIYTKVFTWNGDGTLSNWILTVVSTGETIQKLFTWNADGTLAGCVTVTA